MVAAVVLGLVMLLVPGAMGRHLPPAICRLFGGDCRAAQPYDYKPATSACVRGSNSHKVGGSVTVFSVKVGQSFQVLRTEYADGSVLLTVVPVDFKLGAEGELGAGLKVGKNGGLGAELGAKAEAALNIKFGDAWKFRDGKEADDFIEDLKWDLARKEGAKVSPGLWVFNELTGWEPRTPDPHIQQVEVGVDGALKGALGIGSVSEKTGDDGGLVKSIKDRATGVEIEGKVGEAMLITKDDSGPADKGYPRTSYTLQVQGTVKGGAKVAGYGPGGESSYIGQTKITRDKNGKLLSITWVNTYESTDTEGFKNPGSTQGSAKTADKKVTTTTTTVDFDETNRSTGEKWLVDNAFLMPLQTIRNAADENGAFHSADPGLDADPMDRLIYDRGRTTRNTYAGNVDEYAIAGKVALGVKFGFEASYETADSTLVDSTYLGAPQNGRREFQSWPECKGE